MDPEQRLAVVVEDFAVEFFIILIAALVWMFGPQRVDITDGNRAFVDFYFLFGRGNFNLLFRSVFFFFLLVFCVLVDVLYDNVVVF